MKKITASFKLLSLAAVLSLSACQSEKNQPSPQATAVSQNLVPYIFYASWDSWGHGGSCGGWGLCGYVSCWFCNVRSAAATHVAGVEFDNSEQTEGHLIIAMDPSKADEKAAIAKRTTFIVEEGVRDENSEIHPGKYEFDSSVGEYGGYRVPITVKKRP